MPFNKETAAVAGRKGGSKKKNPADVRNKSLRLAVTSAELTMIDAKATKEKVSRTELVVRAVDKY